MSKSTITIAVLIVLTALWVWRAWRHHLSRDPGYEYFEDFMSAGFRLYLGGLALAAIWLVVLVR